MSLEELSKEEISKKEQALLSHVPQEDPIGNTRLRTHLNWDDDLFWAIRNRLIDRGNLERGRGKGGSVRRTKQIEVIEDSTVQQITTPIYDAESQLYTPMLNVIKNDWTRDNGIDQFRVELTASQGRRATGGKWTRPDITLASNKIFPYVPGRQFELVTFEIKPTQSLDVTVIYEALAHRRAATRSYALLHIPTEKQKLVQEVQDEICAEAKRLGVGVITAGKPDDYDTWEEVVEAARHDPEPERMNDFLSKQVSDIFREEMIRWFRNW